MLQFHPLALKDQRIYTECYQACEEKTADYSFMNIWAWQDKYHYEIAFAEKLCWLRSPCAEGFLYYAPVGNWSNCRWTEIFQRYFPSHCKMVRIPGALAGYLSAQLPESKLISQREHWEYVYAVTELLNLTGEKYSTKRKLANHFRRTYPYETRRLKPSDTAAVLAFQTKWLNEQPHRGRGVFKSLQAENQAINHLLSYWPEFPELYGQGIWIDNKLVAFSIGEGVDDKTFIVHFEKGLIAYKGVYQAMNQIMLENNTQYTWVNREQDLGLPGLRKAKTEYHPSYMIRKYELIY